ncbi:MAG: hypothetical protein IJ153_05715 [Clostridia bacterium]|nr:hypothetical protein [Clostridia bacterium]MBQ9211182.1 hypothetical protein [Clostridia bacterium]
MKVLGMIVCFILCLVAVLGMVLGFTGDDMRELGYISAVLFASSFALILNLRRRMKAGNQVDSVMIAGQESRTKTGSAIGRGAVGGALLGPLGMVAGAAGAKKNTTVTLIIRYKSGRTETKAVKLNSSEFKKYAKYIKMD